MIHDTTKHWYHAPFWWKFDYATGVYFRTDSLIHAILKHGNCSLREDDAELCQEWRMPSDGPRNNSKTVKCGIKRRSLWSPTKRSNFILMTYGVLNTNVGRSECARFRPPETMGMALIGCCRYQLSHHRLALVRYFRKSIERLLLRP